MRSMRARLLAGTVMGTTLVLAVSGVILYFLVRASLWAEFDAALVGKARTLAAMVEQDEGKLEFEIDNPSMPEFERADRPEYLQLWRGDGKVVMRSRSLQETNLDQLNSPVDQPVCRAMTLPDGRPGRLVALTFRPRLGDEDEHPGKAASSSGSQATLAIARETAGIDQTLGRLRILLIGVGAAAIVISSVVLTWVVRAGLRPMHRLAGRIEQLDETDLATRLELPDAPSELMPVVDRLNGLLHRLDAAFTRERTLTADVAHELRTPLAGLRSTLEVAVSRERAPEAYRAAMQDSLTITGQMQTLVHNLLALARIEAGQLKVDRQPVDLGELLRRTWTSFAARADQRGVEVRWQVDGPCLALTDPQRIQQVMHNLLDNAVTYVNEQGQIQIETGCTAGLARVTIANSGSRLSARDAEHVFERFWRGDAARADTGVHCGLGLSLSDRIMKLLGGSISVDSTPQGFFRVVLAMSPAQPASVQ